MVGHLLELRGCTPDPLGNYLKALGVFRLLAEQADPQVLAWWKDGVLVLQTKWSKEELLAFFLCGIGDCKTPIYLPTPIFAPWGGRPGFFLDGNDKARKRLDVLRVLDPPGRFALAQQAVRTTDTVLKEHGWAGMTKNKRDSQKTRIVAAMRNAWSETGIDWFDACLALEEKEVPGSLYGTGGNEGSADITNNFWELLEETLGLPSHDHDSTEALAASLFGSPRVGGTKMTAGQHFPQGGGSANCGQDFWGSSSTNSWDVILMMEGAVLFAGATTKRLSQLGKGKAAFPFMLDHLALDERSTSRKDETKQDPRLDRCRAEFWMPIWSAPTSYPAIRALLAEGRLQRPSGNHTEHTIHAMEALRSLGISRGIDTFQRVALFERRGKGYYLSSSLGFYPTSHSSASSGPELKQLEEFRDQVYRNLREGPAVSDRMLRARQQFHTAVAAVLTRDESSPVNLSPLLNVIVSAAQVEREVIRSKDPARFLAPCPPLSWNWRKLNDRSRECRLAQSIAALTMWGETKHRPAPTVESLRTNLLPVERRGKAWKWNDSSRSVVWSWGASLEVNLISVLRRRLIDSGRGPGQGLPLWGAHGAGFSDLLAYWQRNVDEKRLSDLIHGFALLDHGVWNQAKINERQLRREPTPDLQTGAVWFDANEEARTTLRPVEWRGSLLLSAGNLRAAFELPRVYHLLKLCFTGGRLPHRPVEGRTIPRTGNEPYPPQSLDVLTLLQGGRLRDSVRLATCRLRSRGYPSVIRDADLGDLDMTLDQCRRLASMLLIPVRHPGICAGLAIRPITIL